MVITLTSKQKASIINEIQSLALQAQMSKRQITVGAIVDLINNLPEQEIKTPWYKRLWR